MEKRPGRPEPRPKAKPIDSIQSLQDIYAQFSAGIGQDSEPKAIHSLLQGEVDELHDALNTKDRQEIGSEIADVILFAVELANQHQITLNEAIGAKMTRNYAKYNPFEMQRLVGEGMTFSEARDHMKSNWDRSQDKEFK